MNFDGLGYKIGKGANGQGSAQGGSFNQNHYKGGNFHDRANGVVSYNGIHYN